MNRIRLKLKLLLADRLAVMVYIITMAVFLVVFSNLNFHAEERSSIPVGLVCLDDSKAADLLCERVKNTSAFYVYEGSLSELQNELLDGYINTIFVVEEGYGERVKSGDTDELITVYSGSDDKTSVLLQDIFAGCMMYDVVQDKGYKRYKKLGGGLNNTSKDDYYAYALSLSQTEEFTFGFDTEYVDGEKDKSGKISNALLYKQIIAGMTAMLLSIIAFTAHNSTALEYENGIVRRHKTIGPGIRRHLADLLAIIFYCIPADLLISVFLSPNKVPSFRFIILNVIFSVTCVIIFWLAAILVRNVQHYQLLGAFFVLLPGAVGFYSIFSGIMGGSELFRLLPNSVYIRYFVDLI